MKSRSTSLPKEYWLELAKRSADWRVLFNPNTIMRANKSDVKRSKYISILAKCSKKCRKGFSVSSFASVFGDFHPSHSFNQPLLDWRLSLTETNVTKTLAGLLDSGESDVRAARIRAFLIALKTPDIPHVSNLRNCKVFAEKDRIDLEIWLPEITSGKFRPIIVEAKFNHKITPGQLKKYTDLRLNKSRRFTKDNAHYVVLGLSESAMYGVTGLQRKRWKFVSWRDAWLSFEKNRPREDNLNLSIFLRLLWQRIDGLNNG